MDILILLLIGAAAGWLAGQIMQGKGFGTIGNIIVGILGGVLGGWLLPKVGFSTSGSLLSSIISSTIGAVVLIFIANFFQSRRRR